MCQIASAKSAGEVDLGDLGPALFAEPLPGPLVAIAVERVRAGVGCRLDQRPAQVAGVKGVKTAFTHAAAL
jgi:hypothetical protein